VGSVVGGTEGALIAGSADRFNRQLHPTEIDLIKENADVFAEENNLRDENGELDVAQAEQQLTQAFLSEADNAWDIAYDNQGVVISEDATAFIAGLREQHAETGEFTVQEGDRENRLLNASTVRSDLEFYYDNAATDRGRTLLDAKDLNSNGAIYDIEAFQQGEAAGERETKNDITAETNNAIAEGLENADGIGLDVLNRVGDFAADPIGSIKEYFVEDKEEYRIKQLQQNTKNEVVLLETLEGDAYSVGYLEGSENAIFHAEVENAIGVGLLGGSVARVLADDLPNRSSQDDINTVHLEKDVAPNKELLPLSNVGVPEDIPKKNLDQFDPVPPQQAAFPADSVGAGKVWTKTARIKDAQLPNEGKIRFVPPKNWDGSTPLVRGLNKGFIDKFGNEWTKGPSRTEGQAFEWDVQLSPKGREQIGWTTRDGSHANVSLDGKITHK
jgi:hypothetical protein